MHRKIASRTLWATGIIWTAVLSIFAGHACLAAVKAPIHLAVEDSHGASIADSGVASSGKAPVKLAFDREYQPGDRIVLTGPSRIVVQLDQTMPECMLYLANSPQTKFTYEIPYGPGEPASKSPFDPGSFAGKSHTITARAATSAELSAYRNLALNPCDRKLQPEAAEDFSTPPPAFVFPHASTNSVSRNLPDFEARNAIDGRSLNGHHGVWPYQSWGPQLRLDLWWKVDFGRPVEVDKLRLMVRADFPHDSYWKSAVVEFSDGTQLPIQITNSPEFQDFKFPKRRVSWIRLNKLVPADPARWCAFIEVEAWGHDLK